MAVSCPERCVDLAALGVIGMVLELFAISDHQSGVRPGYSRRRRRFGRCSRGLRELRRVGESSWKNVSRNAGLVSFDQDPGPVRTAPLGTGPTSGPSGDAEHG